jgi:signal peptidase I
LANTFTGLQTINGNLKADFILVNNTTPVLTSHLTSKFYVDTALNTKQNTVTSGDNITIKNNIISSIG